MKSQYWIAVALSGLTITAFQNCGGGGLPDTTIKNTSAASTGGTDPNSTPTSAASCVASAISNCKLPAQSSGNVGGACATGFSGTCSFQCSNGNWSQVANSCVAISPVTLCKGTFNFNAPGNASGIFTISQLNSDGTFSGIINLGGIYTADPISGSCTSSAMGSGYMSFTRTHGQIAQVFNGNFTTTDYVHATVSAGTWYFLGVPQGSWTASTQ